MIVKKEKKNPKKSNKIKERKTTGLISKFSIVVGYEVNLQKKIYFYELTDNWKKNYTKEHQNNKFRKYYKLNLRKI
jgi:hypothetical protein